MKRLYVEVNGLVTTVVINNKRHDGSIEAFTEVVDLPKGVTIEYSFEMDNGSLFITLNLIAGSLIKKTLAFYVTHVLNNDGLIISTDAITLRNECGNIVSKLAELEKFATEQHSKKSFKIEF